MNAKKLQAGPPIVRASCRLGVKREWIGIYTLQVVGLLIHDGFLQVPNGLRAFNGDKEGENGDGRDRRLNWKLCSALCRVGLLCAWTHCRGAHTYQCRCIRPTYASGRSGVGVTSTCDPQQTSSIVPGVQIRATLEKLPSNFRVSRERCPMQYRPLIIRPGCSRLC